MSELGASHYLENELWRNMTVAEPENQAPPMQSVSILTKGLYFPSTLGA